MPGGMARGGAGGGTNPPWTRIGGGGGKPMPGGGGSVPGCGGKPGGGGKGAMAGLGGGAGGATSLVPGACSSSAGRGRGGGGGGIPGIPSMCGGGTIGAPSITASWPGRGGGGGGIIAPAPPGRGGGGGGISAAFAAASRASTASSLVFFFTKCSCNSLICKICSRWSNLKPRTPFFCSRSNSLILSSKTSGFFLAAVNSRTRSRSFLFFLSSFLRCSFLNASVGWSDLFPRLVCP
mmetsp:Transcript_25674/g.59178  ORF Transcript_25674/g.59178 Transcript_25674/m.59178 type:complete len:236 (+) Transcript_25674:482-1189(+)